jgi:zinc protease
MTNPSRLKEVKSHLKYDFALSLDNSEAIATALSPYIALRRTPETINRLYEIYDAITLDDLKQTAEKYFVEQHRTIVTLAHG